MISMSVQLGKTLRRDINAWKGYILDQSLMTLACNDPRAKKKWGYCMCRRDRFRDVLYQKGKYLRWR